MLKGIRLVDFVSLGVKEPEIAEAFSGDKLELQNGVWIRCGVSQVGNKGMDRGFCHKRGLQRGSGVVKMGLHS
jgi:hypothetical protein